jgi:hypothetical protein
MASIASTFNRTPAGAVDTARVGTFKVALGASLAGDSANCAMRLETGGLGVAASDGFPGHVLVAPADRGTSVEARVNFDVSGVGLDSGGRIPVEAMRECDGELSMEFWRLGVLEAGFFSATTFCLDDDLDCEARVGFGCACFGSGMCDAGDFFWVSTGAGFVDFKAIEDWLPLLLDGFSIASLDADRGANGVS